MSEGFMHRLTTGAASAKDAGGLEVWLLNWMQHLTDLIRATGDDVEKTNALAAAIDESAVHTATTISDKIAELAAHTADPVVEGPTAEAEAALAAPASAAQPATAQPHAPAAAG